MVKTSFPVSFTLPSNSSCGCVLNMMGGLSDVTGLVCMPVWWGGPSSGLVNMHTHLLLCLLLLPLCFNTQPFAAATTITKPSVTSSDTHISTRDFTAMAAATTINLRFDFFASLLLLVLLLSLLHARTSVTVVWEDINSQRQCCCLCTPLVASWTLSTSTVAPH